MSICFISLTPTLNLKQVRATSSWVVLTFCHLQKKKRERKKKKSAFLCLRIEIISATTTKDYEILVSAFVIATFLVEEINEVFLN